MTGTSVPVTGWGQTPLPYGGFPRVRSSKPATYVAECNGAGPLGFDFEKVEKGGADYFNFVLCVTEVEKDSWAELAGIQVGDIILRLNALDVAPMTKEMLQEKLAAIRPFTLYLEHPSDFGGGTEGAPEENEYASKGYYFSDTFNAAKKASVGFIANPSKTIFEVPPGVLKMFPTAFLLFSLAIFVMPCFLVWYVGQDLNAQQWLPHLTNLVFILPFVYIITFIAHVLKKGPSKLFVSLSLIVSCALLLIVSDVLLMDAYEKIPLFAASGDCMSWGEKRMIEQEWKAAASYYASCMNDKATEENIPYAAAVQSLRITDCSDYATVSVSHPAWDYLQELEHTAQCGGWCTASPPLWTKGKVQDACSPVVAQAMRDNIAWVLKQVVLYTVFALLMVSVILIGIPSILERYNIEW
jgi:hypothetical protein